MAEFDISGIDEVIHGRLRLGVMAYLAGAGTAEFNELKARLQASDGNLSVHLRKLEEAGYVAIDKSFQGRKAFVAYLDAIGRLVETSPRGTGPPDDAG